MTNYLLDTNHLSPLVTLRHPLHQRVLQEAQFGHSFAIVVPALTEFVFGIGIVPRAEANLANWQLLANRFVFYDIDLNDAEQAAYLRIQLRRKGWQLTAIDAMIAVVAIRYDLTLLTTDKDFRAVPELKTESWL